MSCSFIELAGDALLLADIAVGEYPVSDVTRLVMAGFPGSAIATITGHGLRDAG
jgi:hypothetical protein